MTNIEKAEKLRDLITIWVQEWKPIQKDKYPFVLYNYENQSLESKKYVDPNSIPLIVYDAILQKRKVEWGGLDYKMGGFTNIAIWDYPYYIINNENLRERIIPKISKETLRVYEDFIPELVNDLEGMKKRPVMFFRDGGTFENFTNFINGLYFGLKIGNLLPKINLRREVEIEHGWDVVATSKDWIMQQAGLTKDEIYRECIGIEQETWRRTLKLAQDVNTI